MKTFYAVLVALILFAPNIFAQNGEIVITGYGIGEFAVKGKVLAQAEKAVETIKSAQPDSTVQPDSIIIKITVIGSADVTGAAAKNDQLSRDRAEAMKSFLNSSLNAEINVLPMGDQDNQRQVKIKYEFVCEFVLVEKHIQPVANFESPEWWIIIAIGLIVLIFFSLVTLLIRGRKKEIVEVIPATKSPDEDYYQSLPVEFGGEKYTLQILRSKRPANPGSKHMRLAYICPFANNNGGEVFDLTPKQAGNSFSRFASEMAIKKLMEEGKISVKK